MTKIILVHKVAQENKVIKVIPATNLVKDKAVHQVDKEDLLINRVAGNLAKAPANKAKGALLQDRKDIKVVKTKNPGKINLENPVWEIPAPVKIKVTKILTKTLIPTWEKVLQVKVTTVKESHPGKQISIKRIM